MAEKLKLNLTETQNRAVEGDVYPLVVRAGAGSGKTTVLVQRYLRLLLSDNIPPKRILAATFTEKAAAEMKERVADELVGAGRPELVAQLNAAPICTLHSFCSRLIASLALSLGLDPNYRILDQYQADLLQEESLTQVLRGWRSNYPEKLEEIVAKLHWAGDYGLRPGRTPSSRGFARQFLNLVEAVRCAGDRSQTPFAPLQVNFARNRSDAQETLSRLDALLWDMDSQRAQKSQQKALHARNLLDSYLNLPDPQSPEIPKILTELKGIPLRVTPEIKAVLKTIRDEIVPLLLDEYYDPVYESTRSALNRLYTDFLENYRVGKAAIGALDFLDLEEIALDILRSKMMHQPVDRVLIDEAQDLNRVQWKLVKRLGRHAPIFAVGDIQQSIYGFRHAEVRLFADFAAEAREGSGDEVILNENFRSRKSVLEVVNNLFERLWKNKTHVPFLKLEGKYPYPPHEYDSVELLVASGPNRQDAREAEAQHLARRIWDLVQGGSFQIHREVREEEESAPILQASEPVWSDVRVLVRSGSSFDPLERAFKNLGIPFVIQAGRGFWDALEISDLMALLRALEDPGDSFSLACLLRSPAVGFSDDDLVELRTEPVDDLSAGTEVNWKTRPLYEGLKRLENSEATEGTLAKHAAEFLQLFNHLYWMKDRLPLRTLLEIWIQETGLEAYWAAEPNGHLMHSNVRKFLRLCDARAGEPSARLRAAFDETRIRDLREGSAPEPLSGEGAVQVMTVHSAKGLEAPIIALFDMNYKPKSQDPAFKYSKDSKAAFCLNSNELGEEKHIPRLFRKIKQEAEEHQEAENQRVLYVAMTRAREKLLLSASCTIGQRGIENPTGWFDLLRVQFNLNKEAVFSSSPEDSRPVPLIDGDGRPTGILLKRAWGEEPSAQEAPVSAPPQKKAFGEPPAGFPAQAEPGFEPISVVELLQQHQDRPVQYLLSEDGDILSDEVGGTGGIAMGRWAHRLLEVLPQSAPENDWAESARREALFLYGSEPAEQDIDEVLRLVRNYFRSPLARSVSQAQRVLREFPILFELERIPLRGKLDLAFEDESGWTLVDFKSDRLESSEAVQRSRYYQTQLLLYALGWRELTRQLPQNALLFYLHAGTQVQIPLRQENINQVIRMLASP